MADPKNPTSGPETPKGATNGAHTTNGVAHADPHEDHPVLAGAADAPAGDDADDADEVTEETNELPDFDGDAAALPPAPPSVAELCAACIRFVASKYKVALDGEPDTLSLVDQYVREAREAVKERPESIDLVAPAVGAYLGEVMRHAFGAEWFADGSYESYRLYFSNVYLSFNPIGMAREAIAMEDQEGWHSHLVLDPGERELIEERLAAMPQIDEEEYYLPSTRFDVITVVVQTLRAHAERTGLGDVAFSREDYD